MEDANVGSPIFTASQFNKSTDRANANLLFSNTTVDAVVEDLAVGVFGIDTGEMSTRHGHHAGWIIRKEGTGLRAGRVTYETLVAGSTIFNYMIDENGQQILDENGQPIVF
jgi:hypothetical protein